MSNGLKLTGANPLRNCNPRDAATCGFASGAAASWAAGSERVVRKNELAKKCRCYEHRNRDEVIEQNTPAP
jgi:hypothetical protein